MILKNLFVMTLSVCIASCAYAVPTEIPVAATIINKAMPLLTWVFTLAGGVIAGTKGWQCLYHGQMKAGGFAVGGLIAAGVGFNGLFAENALTILI